MRLPCLIFFVSVLALPLVSEASPRFEFEPPVAIVNATITTAPGASIENGVVVMDRGVIVAVGPTGQAEIPPGCRIFDGMGLYVYAGFIDASTHAGIALEEPGAEERALLEDENPDVREGPQAETVAAYRRLMHPHWRSAELYDARAAKPDEFRRAGFTAALVTPKPAIFSGASAVLELGDRPRRQSILKADFAQHVAFTSGERPRDFSRRMEQMPEYPTTIIGAIAAFRQIMHDARWYNELREWSQRHPRDERPPFDPDLEALWQLQDGSRRVVFFANTENEIHRALDAAKAFRLKPIIAGGREGWKAASRLAEERVPVIVSLKWSNEPERPSPPKKSDEAAATQPESKPGAELDLAADEDWEKQPFEAQRLFDERVRLWQEEVDNLKGLRAAGVRCAIGSYEMQSVRDLMKNLRTAIKRGLDEKEALAALTADAAQVLGLSDRVGTIAPGLRANLTVLDKPVADEKARVRWTFIAGRRFDASLEPKRFDFRELRKLAEKGPDEKRADAKRPDEKHDAAADTQPAAESQPSTAPAVEWPEYAVEIEADRKPSVQTGGDVLLKNATLLTVTRGTLEETDLMIQDGRISAIGRGLSATPRMRTIDLRGFFVMPGIIDCHSHICSDGGLNEFSLSVTPEVRIADVVDHTDVAAFRALAGGVTCIHTMHGSANTIGGQNVVLRLKYGKPAAEWVFPEAPVTVKFALGENVKQSNFGRRGSRFPNTRMGVEAVMRRSFDAARQYRREWAEYEKARADGKDPRPIRRDLRLETLTAILDGSIWVHTHCYRADEILRLLDVAESFGFRIAVLQHVLEGYRVIPEFVRHGCGVSTFSDWWAYKLEAFDAIPHNAARMVQGGGVTTVNSDSPELMRHLNLEAAKSLRYGGLSPDDCLKLVTIHGAIQLGVDAHVGSLEPGKRGDIAVFDGHPLDTFSRCVLTLIDGEVFFQEPALNVEQPVPHRSHKEFHAPRALLDVPPSANGRYVITGATVHPVSGPAVENVTLVIAGGRIERVLPRGEADVPADAVRVDAAALHVYPGLINAYGTLGLTEIGSVAGSVDTADIGDFQPDLRAESAFNPFASAIKVALCEGVTSALLVPGGGAVAGQAGLVRMDGWSMPESLVESGLGLVVSLPSLPVRFPDDIEPDKKREQVDAHRKRLAAIEEFFQKARQYVELIAAGKRPSLDARDFDRRFEAMVPYVTGKRPVMFRAQSYKQIREALRFGERYGVRPVIVGGREAWKLAGELAERKVDVILDRTTSYPADKFEPYDSVYAGPHVLARSGVRFAISVPDASLAKLLGIEAGYAVAYGLDAEVALRSITLDAARIIGVDAELGSIEPGKAADLIICTGTPLQADNQVVAAFVGGRPVALSSKHSEMDDQWRARPVPSLPPPAADLKGPPAMRLPAAK